MYIVIGLKNCALSW